MSGLRPFALYFAWLISLIALLVSLYYGEILDVEPCRLCWYQRIAMYPLVLFLGIAAFKNDRRIALYCLPLIFLGALIAIYQSLTQLIPSLHISALCGQSSYCMVASPFPFLSALAFVLIAFFTLFSFSENPPKG
ncbi:MAG: hypothetical protein COT85_07430 [Chlamydiae bacterium CG10_big_fil_rev_8_21_14_0_10_42_34]|nr:MAG: hypothetical protein COT85_07430 [Chlamydiae bacterium CG10_big_fil_rev_8_21_14_0_10_42_34]